MCVHIRDLNMGLLHTSCTSRVRQDASTCSNASACAPLTHTIAMLCRPSRGVVCALWEAIKNPWPPKCNDETPSVHRLTVSPPLPQLHPGAAQDAHLANGGPADASTGCKKANEVVEAVGPPQGVGEGMVPWVLGLACSSEAGDVGGVGTSGAGASATSIRSLLTTPKPMASMADALAGGSGGENMLACFACASR